VGFLEPQLPGTATQIALKYGRNPDRRHLEFEFVNPSFFGRRTLLSAAITQVLSDGNRGDWQFGLPFHETAAPVRSRPTARSRTSGSFCFADDSLVDSTHHRLPPSWG